MINSHELILKGNKIQNKHNNHEHQEILFITSYQIFIHYTSSSDIPITIIQNLFLSSKNISSSPYFRHVSNPHPTPTTPLVLNNLLELNLQNCHLNNLNFLKKLIHIKYLSLSNNLINEIPSFFSSFYTLHHLDLSYNSIENISSILILKSILSLKYLNLSHNLIINMIKYRREIIKLCPSLLGLDSYLISDEERYPKLCYYKRSKKYKSCSKELYLEPFLRISYPKQSLSHLIISQCARLHALQRFANSTSPLYILKKYCRKWMKYSILTSYIPRIIKLQALVRRFLFHCRINKAVQEVNLQFGDFEREYHMIHVGYVAKFAVIIQRKWRLTRKNRLEKQSATRIQQWFRRAIRYHKGLVRWLRKNHAHCIVFPTKYEELLVSMIQQLILNIPQGCRTREILENVIRTITPIDEIVEIRSRKKTKNWNHTVTISVNFLFIALPKWRRSNGKFDEKMDENVQSRTFTTEVPITIKRKSWYFSPCLCYATKQQRKLLYLLKRRGCHLLPNSRISSSSSNPSPKHLSPLDRIIWNSRGAGKEPDVGNKNRIQPLPLKYSFWNKALHLSQFVFPSNSQGLMWKIYKFLRYEITLCTEEVIPLYFEHSMILQVSIIEIQRIWRGYIKRKQLGHHFILQIIRSRAIILLQRWWKYHNLIKRRYDLLSLIEKKCHDICDKRLYLDSLIFYKLLRIYQRPQQSSLQSYPEYRGIPIIDIDQNCLIYQPLIDYSSNLHTISTIKQCIPLWASWRPTIQRPPIKSTSQLNNYHTIIRDLISSSCEISLEHFPVDINSEFRVIELQFSSILEAKIRCAMLMLQTYDCVTRSCVAMMTRDFVKRKIREEKVNILAGPSLNRNITKEIIQSTNPLTADDLHLPGQSNEIIPVEGQILLTDILPSWLHLPGSSLSARDMIRYRFLCESLSKRNTYTTKIEKDFIQTIPQPTTSNPYETLREMIQQQLQPPPGYPLHTHRLEAIPLHSPRSNSCEKESDGNTAAIDERLQRHLWDSKRVVSWCSEFPEEQKNSSNPLEEQLAISNIEQVVASRLALIQHSQYERVMSVISPRHRYGTTILEKSSRSPSPSKDISSHPYPHPHPPLSPPIHEEISPRIPRPLSAENPRRQFEFQHRQKIQEIRQKNLLKKQEYLHQEEMEQQSKEKYIQEYKIKLKEIKETIQEKKTQQLFDTKQKYEYEEFLLQQQKEKNIMKENERKKYNKEIIQENKNILQYMKRNKKEIIHTHGVLFAMNRHTSARKKKGNGKDSNERIHFINLPKNYKSVTQQQQKQPQEPQEPQEPLQQPDTQHHDPRHPSTHPPAPSQQPHPHPHPQSSQQRPHSQGRRYSIDNDSISSTESLLSKISLKSEKYQPRKV